MVFDAKKKPASAISGIGMAWHVRGQGCVPLLGDFGLVLQG